MLVGGPPGEKGNGGEMVSEHLALSDMFTTLILLTEDFLCCMDLG